MPKYNEGGNFSGNMNGRSYTSRDIQKARAQIEINVKLPSSPPVVHTDINGYVNDHWGDDSLEIKTVKENIHSAQQSKSYKLYESKVGEFTKSQVTNSQRLINQIKANVLGGTLKELNAGTSSKLSTLKPLEAKPRPAVPGAGVASGIASLGIGYLVDRYAMPYLMDIARRGGGILSAELSYKLGNISEAELAEALRFIRDGNASKWGERINQIRTIQGLAKKGIRSRVIESDQLPFTGGQGDGVLYNIGIQHSGGEILIKTVFGSVRGIINNFRVDPPGYTNDYQIVCRGFFQGGLQNNNFSSPQESKGYSYAFSGSFNPTPQAAGTIVSVTRFDGQPEESTKQPQPTQSRAIVPSITFQPNFFPATPATTDKIPEINKAKPNIILIPAGFPISVSGDSKTVQVTPSTTSPSTVKIPHPRTVPVESDEEKKVPPLTITNPNSPDIKLETFGSGPVTISIPGYNPITVTPGTNKPQGALPIQDVQRQYAPTASTSTPTKSGATPITPPTSPATTKPATTDDLEQFKKDLEKLILTGGLLAGLTPAIQTIGDRISQTARQTTPEALETAAAAGTCRTTQPGGCTTKALDDAVGRVNQNTNNAVRGLDAGAQLEQLRLLNLIDGKIGGQLPGGLAGASTRLSKFLGIDRIFNLLNFLAILHNASMLSASLKVTLLETLSSVGNATGLLQTSEGDNVDLNQVFNQGIETFITSLIGVDAYASMKLTWRKYSSIYRAGSNVLSNVGNMFSSIGNGIEVVGENTGKIGNAIRAAGMVRENAYNFMSEKMNVHTNKFMTFQTTISNVTQVLEAINEIAESTVEGQEAYTEAVKATADFQKQLANAEKNPGIDNKALKEEAAKIKENLVKDPTGEDDEGLLSFLTDR